MKRNLIAALLLSTLLTGCGSLAARGLLPEVQSRRPPDVDLGPQMVLLDESITLSTSLIGTDGRVHLFVTNAKRQLRHIEVLSDTVMKSEILGLVDTDERAAIDAVEQPSGQLRVLIGDKQYVRAAPGLSWQEFKGNRCQRFLPIKNELFCAFVIKGEEVGAPKRTDYYAGLIFIIPWLSWSSTQAAKLVIAQQSAAGPSGDRWLIRGVVDPNSLLDAESDFMAGIDNRGTLHVLYIASRGGAFFIMGGVGPSGGGGYWEHPSRLRYARFDIAQLPLNPISQDEESRTDMVESRWLPIQGTTLSFPTDSPSGKGKGTSFVPGVRTRPLSAHFVVHKMSGNMSMLMSWLSQGVLTGDDWVEFQFQPHDWLPGYTFVITEDLPGSGYKWRNREQHVAIKSDNKGNLHVLLQHSSGGGFWSDGDYFMDYLIKSNKGWSAPLTLGKGEPAGLLIPSTPRTLAANDPDRVFAAWVNDKNQFVGRWIRPRGGVGG